MSTSRVLAFATAMVAMLGGARADTNLNEGGHAFGGAGPDLQIEVPLELSASPIRGALMGDRGEAGDAAFAPRIRDFTNLKLSAVNPQPVCGSNHIIGVYKSPIKKGRCGIAQPVSLYSVNGVHLSGRTLVNCTTARQLSTWVDRVAGPMAAQMGERLSSMKIIASYSCRKRNNGVGKKLSEHSFGNAIDIAGFGFSSGLGLEVGKHYNSQRYGGYLRSIRKGACGIFGTVLGPGTDRFHKNHFHFDVASYRAGPYCR